MKEEKKPYLVWIIQGYDEMSPNGMLTNSMLYELIAPTEDAAIERAKVLHPSKNYRLSKVIEVFPK